MKENEYENQFNPDEADKELYLFSKVKFKDKINHHKSKVVDQVSALPSNIESEEINRKFKIPKLELKKFSGHARSLWD